MRGVTDPPAADRRENAIGSETLPIEIAFLRSYGVPDPIRSRAAESARSHDTGADAALLGEGGISAERFYRALADRLGLTYHTGEADFDRLLVPETAVHSGFARFAANSSGPRALVAPRGAVLSFLLQAAEEGRPPPPISICSPQRFGALIRARFAVRIARDAADGLGDSDPSLTANSGLGAAQIIVCAYAAVAAVGCWLFAPSLGRALISIFLWLLFASGILLRSAAVVASENPAAAAPLSDAELPVYTVIAPLHREARVVGKLIRALDALNYPRAKLDIKLVVERGDAETLSAIAALRLPARYDIIVAPPGAPRTKPRALNIALAASRGELLVVYDAEDEPAPDQLRLAAARFAADASIDALQGRLTIANASDSWLSQLFAIEYSALFDLVNPGLAALDLPIALGGTSNHFRMTTLRRVGGWDVWNVTEDADLGVRLARFGARVGALASDTSEEAPNTLGNWFRQRVRWQKGWMQTLIVHSRQPRRFARELGAVRALSAAVLIAGTVIGGLFGPPLLLDALWRAFGEEAAAYGPLARAGDVVTYILALAGFQTLAIPALVAMRRRSMKGASAALLKMPAYYGLVWIATWVALFDLAIRPFHWGKTDHGRMHAKPALRTRGATR